jgi:hypothetical protein
VILGITGSRNGANTIQRKNIKNYLDSRNIDILHHGKCKGVDEELSLMIQSMYPDCWIVAHPPLKNRVESMKAAYDKLRKPYPYLERNHHIVDASEEMIAVPNTTANNPRSGTWSTVRYTCIVRKPLTIFLPDGEIQRQWGARP